MNPKFSNTSAIRKGHTKKQKIKEVCHCSKLTTIHCAAHSGALAGGWRSDGEERTLFFAANPLTLSDFLSLLSSFLTRQFRAILKEELWSMKIIVAHSSNSLTLLTFRSPCKFMLFYFLPITLISHIFKIYFFPFFSFPFFFQNFFPPIIELHKRALTIN